MTPVDATSTSPGSQPSAAATPAASSVASRAPCGPVATLAFFDTTTMARRRPSATFARLRVTLGPTKRLRVNTAAAGPVRSAASTRKSSVSSLMPMPSTWAEKPWGSAVIG